MIIDAINDDFFFSLSQINAGPSEDSPDVRGCDERLLQP